MAGEPLDDALDQRIAELQARDSSQGAPDSGAAATPLPEPPAPTSPTPATTALPDKEAATMAEIEEALQRLLQPVHDKLDQMGADLASRLAASEDTVKEELTKVNASIVNLRSHVLAVAIAATGAGADPDPEVVEDAKAYLERPSTQKMTDDEKIENTIKYLEAMHPDKSHDERWAAFEKANQEVS